jgi:hypothetical protein
MDSHASKVFRMMADAHAEQLGQLHREIFELKRKISAQQQEIFMLKLHPAQPQPQRQSQPQAQDSTAVPLPSVIKSMLRAARHSWKIIDFIYCKSCKRVWGAHCDHHFEGPWSLDYDMVYEISCPICKGALSSVADQIELIPQ